MTLPRTVPPADLPSLDAATLAEGVRTRRFSAREVVDAHIARIEATHARLNALVADRFAEARREADALDAGPAPAGALAGVPVVIKETLAVAGLPSTGGLRSRKETRSAADEVHVARLRGAGAIVLGVTNVAQLLLFLETDNPLHGRTNHPEAADRSPGGSSGGNAALLAVGGAALALGSDIGGSVRVPSAVCGTVGFKPTEGRLPDRGELSLPVGQAAIPSQVGVMARSVADVALGLEVANGGRSPADDPRRTLADPASVDVTRLRIGMYADDGSFPPSAGVVRGVGLAAEALRAAGATVVPWTPPDVPHAYALFGRLFSADGAAGLKRLLGDDPVDRRIRGLVQAWGLPRWLVPAVAAAARASGRGRAAQLVANYGHTSADAYWQAVAAQAAYRARASDDLDRLGLDLVLGPGFVLPALRHGASEELILGGMYTALYNLLGWPAGVVPVTRVRPDEATATPRGRDVMEATARATEEGSAGLPVSAQIAGRPWRDEQVLAALAVIEADSRGRGDGVAER